jgi:hypothetical protein
MLSPVMRYSGGGLQPLYDTGRTDVISVRGGIAFSMGQAMGHIPGTGTAVNEVQTVTITGTPTGGTWRLIYGTLLSPAIAYNAANAVVKTALETIFGTGNIAVAGGPLPGTAITVTFQGEAGGLGHVLMTSVNALTGGASPAVAVTRTTTGKSAGGTWDAYVDANADGTQVMRRILRYPAFANHLGMTTYGDTPDIDRALTNRGVPAYFQGHFRCTDVIGLDANGVADVGRLIQGTAITDANAILVMTGAG